MSAQAGPTTITDYLQQDHARLDGILAGARGVMASGDVAGARDLFRQFKDGLHRHIRIEEEMLFPLFESATGLASAGPTAVMRSEHVEIKKLLDEMGLMLEEAAPDPARFDALKGKLESVLVPHNEKEEMILYPESDRLIPTESKTELFKKMQEF